MKEKEEDDDSDKGIKNIINNNNNSNKQEYQHNLKESNISLESNKSPTDNPQENENGTFNTSIGFLKDDGEEEKNEPISILNKPIPKVGLEDISSNNLNQIVVSKSDEKSTLSTTTNESFYQKTKRWAGTVWSYINIKNYFPKEEFIEYRNANGDMVKIPKKKLPLKKKKKIDNEEYIVNKTVDRDNNKANIFAAETVPLASHFI